MSFWVNMHDTFMSGWGTARHGRSLYCVECETYEQAEAIAKAATDRSEMRRVAIATRPRRRRSGDIVTVKKFTDLGGPWLAYWRGP